MDTMFDDEDWEPLPFLSGAENDMSQVIDEVYRIIERIHEKYRERTRDHLDSGDRYGIFRHLEKLIQEGVLDEVMTEDKQFRLTMAYVYSPRHPRLLYDDVGKSIMDEEDERLAAKHRREKRENMANQQQADELLARSLAGLRAEGIEISFDEAAAKNATAVEEADRVPLAPARGGPAPRQPFTTGWTYRTPKPSLHPPPFDPTNICDQFLPQLSASAEAEAEATQATHDPLSEWTRLEPEGDNDDTQDAEDTVLDAQAVQTLTTVTTKVNLARKHKERKFQKLKQTIVGGEVLQSPEDHLEQMRALHKKYGRPYSHLTIKDAEKSLERISLGLQGNTLLLSNQLAPDIMTPLEKDFGFGPEMDEEREPTPSQQLHREADTVMGNTQESEEVRAEIPKPGVYDQNWLVKVLDATQTATPEELRFVEYRGWKIHSPKVQLIRIRNFLADEDMDRTLGWEMRFAEIASYLRYLLEEVWDGTQSWGWDVQEAKQMLQTHWAFQKYHYDSAELNLEMTTPELEQRLVKPRDAPDIAMAEPEESEEIKPRYLIHRVPESIHDVDYQIPGRLLRTRFLRWFREDTTRVWSSHPFREQTAGSGNRFELLGADHGYAEDFNTAEVEDETYARCMHKGTLETSRTLREEGTFTVTPSDLNCDEEGHIWPDGGLSKEWSHFRGAKRAAIQQCLARFDGSENTHLITPFRKLVLPIPFRERKRLEKEAQKKIVYSNFAIKNPPSGVQVDPFAWTHWHKQLRDNHDEKARACFKSAQHEFQTCGLNDGKLDAQRIDLTSTNFNGPFVPSFLSHGNEGARKKFKELSQVHSVLVRACRRAPRPVLKKMLRYVEAGLDKDLEAPRELDKGEYQAVLKELDDHRTRNGLPENRGEYLLPIPDASTLWWLRYIAGPSTNEDMLQSEGRPSGEVDRIFFERLKQLLDDPWNEGILARHRRWASVHKITKAINNKGLSPGRGTPGYVFSEDYVETMCNILTTEGFLTRKRKSNRTLFARPYCDLHPEDRINWRVLDTLDNRGNRIPPEHPQNDQLPPAGDDNLLDWVTARASHVFDATNLLGSEDPTLRQRTERALMLIGVRLGYNIRVNRDRVYSAYKNLEKQGLGERFTKRVDVYLLATRDMHHMFWRGTATSNGDATCVSYGAVVRAADPERWEQAMSKDVYNLQAMELVRQNKIRELSEAENMLWPVREIWHTDQATGVATKTYRRETIWDFAADPATRPHRRFFSIDRWPLHVQTEERQREIAEGGFQGSHLDVEFDYDAVKLAQDTAKAKSLAEEYKRTSLLAELAVVQHEKERALHQIREQAPRPQDVIDPKWSFTPNKEFWMGDTRRQKHALDTQIKMQFETAMPVRMLPNWGADPPISPLSGRKARDPGSPEVRIPRLPRATRSLMPRTPKPRKKPVEPEPEQPEEDEVMVSYGPGPRKATAEEVAEYEAGQAERDERAKKAEEAAQARRDLIKRRSRMVDYKLD